ncbi:ATP-binding cassette domain-containing protein [Gordonia sp. (in: high G+C Gram-positive bacteria)]|uniref:ATP-binding cassette domain-containing protein n=1 Tax=Gordonia sp. (in: high G+C Gram-positive bacteria) TaxID=84139 RepID=UPI003F956EA6
MTRPAAVDAFARLLPALYPERRAMVWSFAAATASAGALVALTVLIAAGVGHAVVDGTSPDAWWWCTVLALVVARTVLTWHEMDVSHALAYRVLARLRSVLFDAYARSAGAHRRAHSGRSASIAMDGIERLEFFYAHTVAQMGASVVVFVGAIGAAAVLAPITAVVTALGGVLVLCTSSAWARTARRLGAADDRARELVSVRVVDALGALREVLSYGITRQIVGAVADATDRANTVHRLREMAERRSETVRDVVVTAVTVGVLAAADGAPALLPALVALALAGVSAASDVAATATRLHPLTADAVRVANQVDAPTTSPEPVDPHPVPDGRLGIHFDQVHFTYDGGRDVLRSWTLLVAPGEHIGLTGPSGSGKSTVLALASRLRDPVGGRIRLVGRTGSVALPDVADADLRSVVAVVDQDATMFSGTVRDNLLRGTDRRDDAELTAVLHRVGVSDRVRLDDELGQSGLRLSGGQRARLALARALVRRPRVLLVDEVTASLDPDTERAVSATLADFDGTLLVATHRSETLARLHRVVEVGPVPSAQDQPSDDHEDQQCNERHGHFGTEHD